MGSKDKNLTVKIIFCEIIDRYYDYTILINIMFFQIT